MCEGDGPTPASVVCEGDDTCGRGVCEGDRSVDPYLRVGGCCLIGPPPPGPSISRLS